MPGREGKQVDNDLIRTVHVKTDVQMRVVVLRLFLFYSVPAFGWRSVQVCGRTHSVEGIEASIYHERRYVKAVSIADSVRESSEDDGNIPKVRN